MTDKDIKIEAEIEKAKELFERTIRLQQRAGENGAKAYQFEFHGNVFGVTFLQFDSNEDWPDVLTHYFGETYGEPMEAIEEAIAKEEAKYEPVSD